MKIELFAATLLSAVVAGATAAQAAPTLLLRQPAISADRLAFVYAGDLWVAHRDGSEPRRLTTHPADEGSPSFSPDGSKIAFRADYEGNVDVYVIPAEGGQPQRLTWHPGDDEPTGWTPDGSAVTFISGRETNHGRSGQLYEARLEGGLPEKRMEARIYRGVYDSEGRRLAYIAFGSGYGGLFGGSAGWRGYRGGTTPAIQILDVAAETVTTVPGEGATNFNPIWLAGELYFLSDRHDKVFNLFHYHPATGAIEQLSHEEVWDVRSAAGYGSTVVYEAGGRLKSLDLGSGTVREIVISIDPDLEQLKTRWRDAKELIETTDISPTGKRAVVTARGEIFTVPVDEGSTRNLTATAGVREYTGLWSPAGDRLAFIRQNDAGQSLVLVDQTGAGEPRTFELGPHFYFLLAWGGGDDPHIVYRDNHLNLYAFDVGSGVSTKIATGARRADFDVAISRDGRWLAYTLERPNFQADLVLHDFASGSEPVVSDGMADVAAPAFSRDGRYLYFAASTNSGPLQVGLNMTSEERPYRAGLYALVLAADGASPLLPKRGDEGEADDDHHRHRGKRGDGDRDEQEEEPPAETRVDLEGLARRIVALPVAERSYSNLEVARNGDLYYVQAVQPGASNEPPGHRASEENQLMRFDFEERSDSAVRSGVGSFSISADGRHMLVRTVGGKLLAGEIGKELEVEPLDLGGLRVRIEPRVEWAQIFDDAWRMEKEYFYAPNLHGLDWQGVYDRYRPLVDHLGRREDLNDLLVQMIAEIQVGHNRARGGDTHHEPEVETGLLGANLAIVDGHYRITKVYTGEAWNPFLEAPLAVPGNEAREGEYILAVNGHQLTARDNLFAQLQNTVGQQVALEVGPSADGAGARTIVVEPVVSERQLRLWSWIEANRRAVDEATGGRVGYIYLPNTAGAGYTFFNRMFFAQVDKEALILDERSNSGGQAANYITEVLSRRHLSGWKDRDGLTYNTPAGAVHGPKVMLIDQDAGSGGDYLPYAFRHLGIGKLIGTRTWGGLIGISANPRLVDGGSLSVPFFRFFNPEGQWGIENEGVAPDLEVPLDPIATNHGRDSQLEAAIAEILAELETFQPTVPTSAPALPTELGQ